MSAKPRRPSVYRLKLFRGGPPGVRRFIIDITAGTGTGAIEFSCGGQSLEDAVESMAILVLKHMKGDGYAETN